MLSLRPPLPGTEELNHLLCSGTDEIRCFDDANDEGLLSQKINCKNKTEITYRTFCKIKAHKYFTIWDPEGGDKRIRIKFSGS